MKSGDVCASGVPSEILVFPRNLGLRRAAFAFRAWRRSGCATLAGLIDTKNSQKFSELGQEVPRPAAFADLGADINQVRVYDALTATVPRTANIGS
jgi:hypothetical protein